MYASIVAKPAAGTGSGYRHMIQSKAIGKFGIAAMLAWMLANHAKHSFQLMK